jgi:hypothetical protein
MSPAVTGLPYAASVGGQSNHTGFGTSSAAGSSDPPPAAPTHHTEAATEPPWQEQP